MKKLLLFTLILLLIPLNLEASFRARNENGHSWHYFKLHQLDCDVEVFGLFYETTITFEIRLTPLRTRSPEPGNYNITWDFSLVEGAVITDCQIKPFGSNEFTGAEIVDLSTAEDLYRQYPYSQPSVVLRHRYERRYDGNLYKRFQMQFSPVTLTQAPTIKIRYLLPCIQRYSARRLTIPFNEFYVYKPIKRQIRIRDHNNPNTRPVILAGYPYSPNWKQENGFWAGELRENYYSMTILNIAAESEDRSYLNTYTSADGQFYQLSIAPPITPADRTPKNILLAVDVTAGNNNYSALSSHFEQAVKLSSAEQDSITMLYSAFIPEIYDSSFVPVTDDVIKDIFEQLRAKSLPQINTLPHLLKQAINVLNLQNKAGEIWLLTDARAHSSPPETALEIISQTLAEAEKPVVFRIISADFDTWPYFRLNGKYYYGNDYLYENLSRLSWGGFVKLREYPSYDHLDAMLDAICPTASSVEVDPVPVGGFTYSRFKFNQGRVNFPLTLPSYEVGLFDGETPFTTSFYGQLDGDLFAKDVTINPVVAEDGWAINETLWFEQYVQNLLLEPQSFATISYIEDISLQKRILTPYSGFIVPGPDGLMAFQRLSAEFTTDVQIGDETKALETVPKEIKLSAYPNPFNASTKLYFELPQKPDVEKIEIRIVNLLGQSVRSLDLPTNQPQSSIEWQWDGRNDHGIIASSGVYIVLARMGNLTKNIKVTLVK